jgi:hypothetical protein
MKFGGIFFLVAPSGDLDICPQREICNGQRVIGRLRSPIQARASTRTCIQQDRSAALRRRQCPLWRKHQSWGRRCLHDVRDVSVSLDDLGLAAWRPRLAGWVGAPKEPVERPFYSVPVELPEVKRHDEQDHDADRSVSPVRDALDQSESDCRTPGAVSNPTRASRTTRQSREHECREPDKRGGGRDQSGRPVIRRPRHETNHRCAARGH